MNPNLKILTDAIEFIERNLENNVSLQKTADNSNCSPQLLNKIFQGYCSFSTGAYIRKRILSKTAEELKHNNVSNTARKFNYDEPSFTRAFKKEFGVTPCPST
ncbi:helix-turn-helix domain-containing protein [Bacillus cereus group sp. BceL293]|uniref:helix-turn-helix domain-containing protein n=1 Tax=Bacillus cereus group sp. BceL293 TaxID=3444992 RepID=UPI003F219E6B